MKNFTEDNLKEVMNKQFDIAWYNFNYDLLKEYNKKKTDWYWDFYITQEEENEFREFLKKYLKPFTFKSRIDSEVEMFILNYWFKRQPEWLKTKNNFTGWFTLVNDMIQEIEKLNVIPENFILNYMKEKYWTLRVEFWWYNDAIFNIINKYETSSETTCEVCWNKWEIRDIWRMTTLCDNCLKEWK